MDTIAPRLGASKEETLYSSELKQRRKKTADLMQACVVATAVMLLAIIVAAPRSQGIDDLGLYNPIHVWLTTGHWAYPIYYQFDGMSVHPPFRYMEIAILMWAGVPQYAALAIMPAFFTVLSVWLLGAMAWEPEPKAAVCVAMIVLWLLMFRFGISIRPDAELTIIWIAGLFALEYARQRHWPVIATAFAGALMTYASVMHYIASLGVLGAAVYLIPIWRKVGFRKMLPTAGKLIAGGACILVPYLVFYIIPNWKYYGLVFNIGESSLFSSSFWKNQFALYQQLAQLVTQIDPFSFRIIAISTAAGIPPFVPALLGFALWPRTRILGLATLPMVLFIFIQSRKWVTYLYPEFFVTILGFCLVVAAVLPLVLATWRKIGGRPFPRSALAAAAFVVCVVPLVHPDRIFATAAATVKAPEIMEEDIARAAAKRAIGEAQLVGGRIGLWYVSGATHWYDISDLLWGDNTQIDLPAYFGHFDYFVEHGFMSAESSHNKSHAGVSTWYGEGLLRLRGFYLGSNNVISYIRVSSNAGAVVGDVYSSGVLSEFKESVSGSTAFGTLFCPVQQHELASPPRGIIVDHILLPVGGGVKLAGIGSGQQELILVFSNNGGDLIEVVSQLRGCAIKRVVRGSITKLDLTTVLPLARYDRNVMDFTQMQTAVRDQYLINKIPH